MNKSYILILTLLLCIAFTACKKSEDSDILLDNNPSNTDNNILKEKSESDSVGDGEYNSDKINTIDNITESALSQFESVVYYYITGDAVRMRADASLESNTLKLLSLGTKVEYIDKKGDWIKVNHENEIGYIRNDLLSETEIIDVETIEDALDIRENPIEGTIGSLEGIDNPKIIVKKADRILQLWDGDSLRASYPIGLGWEPVGDKEKEGDGKTPEGTYYVCTRNNFSRFYLSLGLSYPNKDDAYEGLEADLIDQSTYNQIEDAINREVQPPWNTALGGEIMIHGHGSQSDWTAGCIAVDDNIMDILWEHCRMGTRVIIEP